MTIHELFQDGILNLPLEPNNEPFRIFLKKLFQDFKIKIDGLDLSTLVPEKDKRVIEKLVLGIESCIDTYYDGHPMEAYEILSNSFRESKPVMEFLTKNKDLGKTNLYRLRIEDKNAGYHISKDELFHIPFHKRHLVKTQRFSIPGYPCFYLANSIYVAWEEMRRPQLTKLYSMRLKTQRKIKYLDLSTDIYQKNFDSSSLDEYSLLRHLQSWPLFAACSVKVKETDAAFKPEYIIPQMVLQWVRNEKQHQAIKFSSTHIDQNKSKTTGLFYNLVIPVITNCDDGFCKEIQKMFKSTEVVSWQLFQASTGGPNSTTFGTNDKINHDVDEIELIKGHAMPYERTSLAALEHQLNQMHLEEF